MSLFVNLHNHDEYSTLDGVQKVSEYPAIAKSLGMTHISQTNHGNCAGHWAFFNSCVAADIQPILGMEAYIANGDHRVRERDSFNKPYYHLILLAQNNVGLHNLYKLTSLSYTEGVYFKPRISTELLEQHNEGLFATSACLGSLTSKYIMSGDTDAAKRLLDHHKAIFPDRFFVELQPHQNRDQELVNSVLIRLASELGLPLIVTADAHYTHGHDKQFHETTLKMATGYDPNDEDGFSFGDIDVHLHSPQEMVAACRACSIPDAAITNTVHIANLVDSSSYFSDRYNRFPRFKSLPAGIPVWVYLEGLARGGLIRKKGPLTEAYEQRLVEELAIIKKLDMSDYMLVVWEYIEKARELGVMVGAGRGSVAGSLVAYGLNITMLDPIEHGLLFSRFLSESRGGTPILF